MSCGACGRRRTTRLLDTAQQPVPIKRSADNKAQPTATQQGQALRNKVRFTGR